MSIYPALGNHESWPTDQYHIPEYNWLTSNMSTLWANWLPEQALETVKYGGYYSVLVNPGFRIIALNTQYGDQLNFYWLLGSIDYGNQTEWLIAELTQAEAANEKVWIIGHIPCTSVSGVIDDYCDQYAEIVNRFNDTITGQFFGHTHTDQFVIFYDNNSNPTSVQLIAPSVTTFTNINPSFRIFAYDKSTYELLDMYQYHTNLTQANIDNSPTWTLTYQATKDYRIPDLTAASYQLLWNNLVKNQTLLQFYFDNFQALGNLNSCTGGCRTSMLCDAQSSTFSLWDACLQRFDNNSYIL